MLDYNVIIELCRLKEVQAKAIRDYQISCFKAAALAEEQKMAMEQGRQAQERHIGPIVEGEFHEIKDCNALPASVKLLASDKT